MKTIRNRIFSVLLAICMLAPLLSAFSSVAFAAGEKEPGDPDPGAVSPEPGEEGGEDPFEFPPEEEEIFRITVAGGTVKIVGSDEAFDGTAPAESVLEISLEEQPGRTFLFWGSSEGEKIPDPDFRIFVGGSKDFYPVFEDTGDSPFGEWETVYDSNNCEEGILYSRTNALGDVEYRREWNWHDLETVYVNDSAHVHRCRVCDWCMYGGHYWEEWSTVVVKEPTCCEDGLEQAVCEGCGHVFEFPIPAEPEAHEYGPWTVTLPSEGGEYGQRSRTCIHCGDTISCWYLEIDWKALFKDHYVEYTTTSSGGGVTHEERYYSFTNAEGKDVYLLALQYSTSNAYDNRTTWIFMYIDDGNDWTLDPVYLSRSPSDSSSAPASFVNAVYGYVYDFNGWLDAIRWQSFVFGNVKDFYGGNSMDVRDSALLSWADDYADLFNNQYIPASEDPGPRAYGAWEPDGESYTAAAVSVYLGEDGQGNPLYDKIGGFENCVPLKLLVNGNAGEYNYTSVHPATGLTVSTTDNVSLYSMQRGFRAYAPILGAAEYAALDEAHQAACLSADGIEADIRAFCASRNSFGRFTLTPAETPEAVRLQTNFGTASSGPVEVVCGPNVVWSVYHNDAHVFHTAKSEAYPDSYAITLTWKADNADGLIFDAWEIWDFEDAEWKVYSTEPSIKLNTYSDPLTDVTFLRYAAHENEVTHTVRIENGWIRYNGEYYKEVTVKEGSAIQLCPMNWDDWENPDDAEFMEISHYADSHGGEIEFDGDSSCATVIVTGDESYSAVYAGRALDFIFRAENGVLWLNDDEENASDCYDIHVHYKEPVTLHTRGDEANGFTEFLGWYLCWYDKGGEHWEFQTDATDFEVSVDGYIDGDVWALWGNGETVPPEPGDPEENPDEVVIRVSGGFALLLDEYEGSRIEEEGLPRRTAYSCIVAPSMTCVHLIDDPTDGFDAAKWIVKYDAKYGDDEPFSVTDKYEEWGWGAQFWIWDPAEFASPVDVTAVAHPWTITTSAPIEEIGPALLQAGLDTPEKVEEALCAAAIDGFGVTSEALAGHYAAYEITLQVSWNCGESYENAEEGGYFEDGPQTVYLPYPQGIDPMTHDFFVVHMFDGSSDGREPGETELLEVEESEWGLAAELSSVSPFLVFWQESDWTREMIVGRTLIFGSTYEARYLIPVSALDGVSVVKAEILDVHGNVVSGFLPEDMTEMEIGSVPYLTFRSEGFAPKDIDSEYVVHLIYEKNGSRAEDTYEDSILTALTQVVAGDYSDAMKLAANATLDYCEAAAKYFGRADADFGGVPVADYSGYANVVQQHRIPSGGMQIVGASLVLKDELCLKFYIDRDVPDEDFWQYSVELNGEMRDDLEIEPTGGRYWTVKVPVSVSEIAEAFSLRIRDDRYVRSNTYVESVIDYVLDAPDLVGHRDSPELRSLLQALQNYCYYVNAALAE